MRYEVEKHNVRKGSPLWEMCDELCFLSKNLYNATLYAVRQHFFKTGQYLGYNECNKMFKEQHTPDYYAMNTKVAQFTMKLVDQVYRSFFALLKKPECKDNAKIPKYLNKTKGRQVAHFNNQAFSFNTRTVPKGHIKLAGTNIMFKTKVEKPTYVKVTQNSNGNYLILVGYEVPDVEPVKSNNYASIDLGVNNLATVTFTNGKPFIVNGRPLKSMNQYYNKVIAGLQTRQDFYINSVREVCKEKAKRLSKRTNRMNRVTQTRNNKIEDYMHKSSRYIVNQLVSKNISKLIIGYNKGWKQGTNIGDKNNQNFVQIPFLKFVKMLEYKCSDVGIQVILREESYTSKSSFIDRDYIPTYRKDSENFNPSGKRIHRGLYQTKDKIILNADVNGSLNILRKYLKEAENTDIYDLVNLVEVFSTPSVFTVKF